MTSEIRNYALNKFSHVKLQISLLSNEGPIFETFPCCVFPLVMTVNKCSWQSTAACLVRIKICSLNHSHTNILLECWSHKWDMEFNPSKCQVIHITRSKNPIPTQYTLHNCILESVSSAIYLSIDISSDLSWDTYINRINFLKRQTTHLAFRFTPNLSNLLPTKFLFVLS